jgi:hypothetical protein
MANIASVEDLRRIVQEGQRVAIAPSGRLVPAGSSQNGSRQPVILSKPSRWG